MENLAFIIAMAPQGQGGGGSLVTTLVMFGLIFFIFYFMIIRPQKKRQKEREQLLNSLKKGDKVITAGGLHGTIIAIEDKTVLVQVAENVKVKVERGSISTVTREANTEA